MKWFNSLDRLLIRYMRFSGILGLRLALGIVFLWFGGLKIVGASPVTELIRDSYPFLPYPGFIVLLGVWETAIGLGLIFKKALRTTLALLWLQMAGTLVALISAPQLFFAAGNPLLLTIEGEFVVKNLVLIAAGIVIGGYEVKLKAHARS